MSHKLERRNIKATEIRIAQGADGSQVLTGYAVRFKSPSIDLGGFTKSVLLACSHGRSESHQTCVCSAIM
jgi:hypothetical protein